MIVPAHEFGGRAFGLVALPPLDVRVGLGHEREQRLAQRRGQLHEPRRRTAQLIQIDPDIRKRCGPELVVEVDHLSARSLLSL